MEKGYILLFTLALEATLRGPAGGTYLSLSPYSCLIGQAGTHAVPWKLGMDPSWSYGLRQKEGRSLKENQSCYWGSGAWLSTQCSKDSDPEPLV